MSVISFSEVMLVVGDICCVMSFVKMIWCERFGEFSGVVVSVLWVIFFDMVDVGRMV